ncbi:MAG: hypothetical protein KAH21_01840, partial [Spirochaetaceae bacterium]|nr:hypothetical protein [Spirochaetaceae bacterium]
KYKKILILTHVTPFTETCTYKDRPGSAQGFPGFLWDTMGGIIKSAASSNPDVEFLVFSGHTHQGSFARISMNIRAWSFQAEYGELRYRLIQPEAPDSPTAWSAGPSFRV